MKKTILSLLLCILSLSAFAYSWTDANGITWEFNTDANGAYIITITNASGEVTVPEIVYDGETPYTVYSIAHPTENYFGYGFSEKTTITSVVLPSTITRIGFRAFYNCSSLASVDLSSCTSIGNEAFSGCSSLASVGDLSSCTSIGNHAFQDCFSLASVGDLSSCTSIGGGAFYNCSSLASVDLSSCTSIGGGAFQDCFSLASVGDLSACTSIGDVAFHNCSSLEVVRLGEAVPTLGSSAFHGVCSMFHKLSWMTIVQQQDGATCVQEFLRKKHNTSTMCQLQLVTYHLLFSLLLGKAMPRMW